MRPMKRYGKSHVAQSKAKIPNFAAAHRLISVVNDEPEPSEKIHSL